jgi:hypothetical protein
MATPKPPERPLNSLMDFLTEGSSFSNFRFMGKNVKIRRLSLAQVRDIQAKARNVNEDNPEAGFELIKETIRMGVPIAVDISDEQFEEFPLEDLNNLSNEVLRKAGMSTAGKG